MNIALAIAIVTVAGLLGSVILVLAAKFMAVEEDPRIGEVTSCLPGANCGACGYAGCADYAKAIVEGGAPVNKCVPGGAKAAADVAAVMGVEAGATAAVRATVRCQGKPGVCTQIFDYHGVSSCAAAAALDGGQGLQVRRHPRGGRRRSCGPREVHWLRRLRRCLPQERHRDGL